MADTIRDVVIKVAIEAGQYNAASFKSIAEQIKQELQGVGNIDIGRSSAMQGPQTAFSAIGSPSTDMPPYFAPTAYGSHPGIGMPGYGQSVRDRGAAFGAEFTGAMKKESGGAGLDDSHWQKLEQKFSKQAESRIREQDREKANYERMVQAKIDAEDRLEEARKRNDEKAARREEAGRKKAEQEGRQLKEPRQGYLHSGMQGASRVMYGGAGLMAMSGDLETNRMLHLLGIGQSAAGIAGGVSSMTTAGVGMAGLAGTAVGAGLGIGLPIAAGVGAAYIGYNMLSRNESRKLQFARMESGRNVQAAYGAARVRTAMFAPDLHLNESSGYTPEQAAGERTMARYSLLQLSASNQQQRDLWINNQKKSVRSRPEEIGALSEISAQTADFNIGQTGLSTQESVSRNRLSRLDKTEKEYRAAQDVVKAETSKQRVVLTGQRNLLLSHAEGDFRTEKRDVRVPIPFDLWGRSRTEKRDVVTGRDLSLNQQEEMSRIDTAEQGIGKKEAEDLLGIEEKLKTIEEERLKIQTDLVKNLAEQGKTAQQFTQEAFNNWKGAETKSDQRKESWGSMDFGDLHRMKRIQDKGDRIKTKMAANKKAGKNEMQGVESFTQSEIREARASGLDIDDVANAQGRHTAKKFGLRTKESKEAGIWKNEFDKRNEMTKGISERNEGKSGQANMSAEKAGEEIGKHIVQAIDYNAIIQGANAKITEMMSAQKESQMKNRSVTGGN